MTNTINNNSGCSTAILRIFGIKPIRISKKPTEKQPITVLESDEDFVDELPYRTRDDFLSPAELSFYHVINSIVSPQLTVLSKVRLIDIFYVTRPNENLSYRGRIAQKHIDFLLCRPKTMTPVAAIELDDSSHKKPDRIERDVFIDQVFETANLPLIRVPAQRTYNTQQITTLLENTFSTRSGKSNKITTNDEYTIENPPHCPKCNEPMVIRTASRGDHEGKQFYGCPNFPKCRSVIEMST